MRIDDQIAENMRRYQETIEAIRRAKVPVDGGIEVDVPPGEKKRLMAEAYTQAKKRYEELAAKKRASVENNLTASAQEFFKPRVSGMTDPTLVMNSLRDALQRVDDIKDANDLKRQLDRAHYTGDAIQAKAIAIRAAELGEMGGGNELLSHYIKLFPGERERFEQYVQAGEEHNQLQAWGVAGTPDQPQELDNAEGRSALHSIEGGLGSNPSIADSA